MAERMWARRMQLRLGGARGSQRVSREYGHGTPDVKSSPIQVRPEIGMFPRPGQVGEFGAFLGAGGEVDRVDPIQDLLPYDTIPSTIMGEVEDFSETEDGVEGGVVGEVVVLGRGGEGRVGL